MRSLRLPCLALLLSPAFGCTGAIGDKSDPEGTDTVSNEMCVTDTPTRRLTRFEYNNTVRDLLGDTTEPARLLPPEEEIQGFDNQAAALTVSELLAEQYMKVAEDVSSRAVTDLPALLGDCDPALDGDDVCALSFIEEFGRKAFRRPVTDGEKTRLMDLFDQTLADPDYGDFRTGVELVLQAMLQSPAFLYRPEFGGGPIGKENTVQLTHDEIASKLSYMLWNSMPDDVLFDAAERGELGTKQEIEAQARRMLADPKAKDTIRNFHRQWLHLKHIESLSKDLSVYPAYSEELRPLWREEIERFVEHAILEDDGKLSTLLTANYSFMDAELADFYGEDVVGALPSGDAFEKVALDPQRRAGILTQGALMAVHAKGDQSSPVFRGKFVREQLMCQALPLPPADLVIVPPEIDPEKTTREQFEQLTGNSDCAFCHALMNPIGFGFEHYDGVGLWRDFQSGKPIDASGEIIEGGDIGGTFDGAPALAAKLAASDDVAECVSTQWFRFSYNRTVTTADRCTLDEVNEVFAESGYDIRELLVALTLTNTFRYRHVVLPDASGEGGEP